MLIHMPCPPIHPPVMSFPLYSQPARAGRAERGADSEQPRAGDGRRDSGAGPKGEGGARVGGAGMR
jgi:hypothetical protein